jgi:hypothetical protein
LTAQISREAKPEKYAQSAEVNARLMNPGNALLGMTSQEKERTIDSKQALSVNSNEDIEERRERH